MLGTQMKNNKEFLNSNKEVERKIFGINGKDSYKKDFEMFFGSNAYKIHELCFYIV